ncbi:hypothetical protein CRE_24614 [Caenorhabditis remanei]|uniref:Uncharacterized protein n=1 Tax=Caenorhabditis remanei TaxID=31234 RepID=E3MVG2_CAERE|nr:hypothetical protein CRE_24614 [Caenorhabditis remanei]
MTSAETTVDPWKKLLALSTSVTEPGQSFDLEPPRDDDVTKLKPNDMQFLELAMRSTMGGNQGPCLFTQFFLLGGEDPTEFAKNPAKIAAAKELADQLEDYLILGNFADQFVSARGLEAIANLTLAKDEEVQLLYLRLIPQIAENRPEFQKAIAESEVFRTYVELLKNYATMKTHIFLSVLSAISSIVRSSPEAWLKFYEANGIELLKLVAKHAMNDKVAGRAAYLLYSIHFTFAEPPVGDRKRYQHEDEDCGGEEWTDEEELYATVLKERTTAAGGKKLRGILDKPSNSYFLPSKLQENEAKEDKKSREESEKKLPHEHELVDALLAVYIYLKKRVILMTEWKELNEEDFDQSTLDFNEDTLLKIQDLLLRARCTDMTDATRTEMSDFFKKHHRALRFEHQRKKLDLKMDSVAKRFLVPQFYSKKEIVQMKDAVDKKMKEAEAADEEIRKKQAARAEEMERNHQTVRQRMDPQVRVERADAATQYAAFLDQEQVAAEEREKKDKEWKEKLAADSQQPSTSSAAGPSTPTRPAAPSTETRKTPGRRAKGNK